VSDLVRTLITGFLTSIVLLFLVYWFWKLYDRPSKKQLELQEEKREKRKEERMWQAIEAEMEKEREQAEALALIERKKAEMRARAQPPAAGIMQNALATLDSPTEGDEYNERFKPEISEIQEILVDEDFEQEEIDDSDVLLAPELIEVRQDERSNDSEITGELLEIEPSKETNENEQSNDERLNEESETIDPEESDLDNTDPRQTKSITEHELVDDNKNNQFSWDYQGESEPDSWSVSW